jgi:hypothetical protein
MSKIINDWGNSEEEENEILYNEAIKFRLYDLLNDIKSTNINILNKHILTHQKSENCTKLLDNILTKIKKQNIKLDEYTDDNVLKGKIIKMEHDKILTQILYHYYQKNDKQENTKKNKKVIYLNNPTDFNNKKCNETDICKKNIRAIIPKLNDFFTLELKKQINLTENDIYFFRNQNLFININKINLMEYLNIFILLIDNNNFDVQTIELSNNFSFEKQSLKNKRYKINNKSLNDLHKPKTIIKSKLNNILKLKLKKNITKMEIDDSNSNIYIDKTEFDIDKSIYLYFVEISRDIKDTDIKDNDIHIIKIHKPDINDKTIVQLVFVDENDISDYNIDNHISELSRFFDNILIKTFNIQNYNTLSSVLFIEKNNDQYNILINNKYKNDFKLDSIPDKKYFGCLIIDKYYDFFNLTLENLIEDLIYLSKNILKHITYHVYNMEYNIYKITNMDNFYNKCNKNVTCKKNRLQILNLMKKINDKITVDKYDIYNDNIVVHKDIVIPNDKKYKLSFEKGIEFNFFEDNIDTYNGKYKIDEFNDTHKKGTSKVKESFKFKTYFIKNPLPQVKFDGKKWNVNATCSKNKQKIKELIKTNLNFQDIKEDDYYIYNQYIIIHEKFKLPIDKNYELSFDTEFDFFKDNIDTYNGTYKIIQKPVHSLKTKIKYNKKGGSINDLYRAKYIEYKLKYLELKKSIKL